MEVNGNHYCSDNGYFCPYMDGRSGLCIATTCRTGLDLIEHEETEQAEIDKRGWYEEEKLWGMLDLMSEENENGR